ncbi:MAG: hypothetical protein FJ278_18840, partial [Planctomycetes bacterium]|nr:hypothetical protein [Planctomycetota bacterium]
MLLPNEPITVTISDWSRKLYGGGAQHKLIVPAEAIGQQEAVLVKFRAKPRPAPAEDAREKRVLVAMVDWARVRPAREDEAMSTLEPFQPTPREIPVTARLRSVENRPAKADVESFVALLKDGGANVVTISPTNGHVVANFPSKFAVHRPGMDPGWIPNVIKALREAQISVIFWMPFNVQDLRKVEDFAPAKQFPQWTMKFIPDPNRPERPQVGMCVQSSPYREHHAQFIAECAAFDIDAMWFDGFYLGGIPHPTAPGCVCEFCAKRFKQATGLDLPKQVDWADMTFKRWVRWRNEDIIATMAYFRDAIRKVKPGLPVSANTNHWPFGNKDWDTAIPLWRITEFGSSEHAHSGKPELEWLMPGFKSRLSHDTNPEHADIWRPAFPMFRSSGTPADIARHEHDMLIFMLSALSHGVVPWHGGQSSPFESEVRVHHAIAKRERFLSRNEVKHVAVWVSQDTHDFYGHIPGSSNLVDYRDTVLGNWLVLSRAHMPFQFVFDNMVTAGFLRDYKVLLAPNVAAMSAAAAEEVRRWVKAGGQLIFT